MREPTVRDWMRLGVITCRPDTPAPEVAEAMRVHDVSGLVVADALGYALGVVSRNDLVNATFLSPSARHWRGLTARHLMTSPVVSVRADAPLAEAVRLLRDRHVHRVVVTVPEGGRERPIAILSMTDIVEHLDDA
jgi:CBS domain-containing protein